MLEKVKPFYKLLLILVVASIFSALGRLSALEDRHTPIKIEYASNSQTGAVINSITTTESTTSGAVIGSKTGKKYYFPWCGTVKRIKPENQIKFNSVKEAKKAGFVPGGNCKGLK